MSSTPGPDDRDGDDINGEDAPDDASNDDGNGERHPFQVADITGTRLSLMVPVRRVVSLVPSVTETLFAIGAAPLLAGRTRYCIHPTPAVQSVRTCGGTKDPDIARIIELEPDLVLANREENLQRHIDAMREAGLTVHVDQPADPDDALRMIALLGSVTGREEDAFKMVLRGEQVLEQCRQHREERDAANRLRLHPRQPPRVLAMVWRDPWMVAGADTYISSVVETLGGVHAMPESRRYATVTPEDMIAARPDLILLPSEPYEFGEGDADDLREMLAALPAARVGGIRLCNGEDLMWFGSRTIEALVRLRPVLAW